MNPSRSLMGLALGLLLAAAAPAGAQGASAWQVIASNGRQYFITDAALQALRPGTQTTLYQKKDKGQPAAAKLEKDAHGHLFVVEAGMRFAASRGSSGSTSSHRAPATRSRTAARKPASHGRSAAAPRRPQGVTQDVWAMVLADSQIAASDKAHAARALQKVKAASRQDFAAIAAAPKSARDAAIVHVAQRVGSGPVGADVHAAIAADLAAAGTSGAPAGANPQMLGQPRSMSRPGQQTNALTSDDPLFLISDKLEHDPAARQDIEARLARYILRRGAGAFVEPSYIEGPQVAQRLSTVAHSWVDARIKKDGSPKAVAELYYVMGVEQVPAWAGTSGTLHDTLNVMTKSGRTYPGKLEEGMKGWEVSSGTAKLEGHGVKPGAYAGAPVKLEDWVFGFLESAADVAKHAYEDRRQKDEVIGSIGAHDQNGGVPVPGGTRAGAVKPSGASAAGFEEIFLNAGKVWNVALDPSKPPRKLSVRMVSRFDLTSKQMVNELAVYDITETPYNIYGRQFPLDQAGGSIPLKQGGYPYNLSISVVNGKREISLSGPNGQKLDTSQDELLGLRAKAAGNAPVRVINGQVYRREGEPGSYAYFAADASGKLLDANTPALVGAAVGKPPVDQEGRPNPPAMAPLGFIGKGDKRQFYYNVWDPEQGMLVAKPCSAIKTGDSDQYNDAGHAKCDFPPPPAPTTPANQTPAPGSQTPPAESSTTVSNTPAPSTTDTAPSKPDAHAADPTKGPEETEGDPSKFSEACGLGAGELTVGTPAVPLTYAPDSPWTFFLNPAGQPNGYYLCINGDARQTIYGDGIPIWQKTRKEGNFLIIESIKTSEMVDPEKAKAGHVDGAEFKAPGLDHEVTLAERHIHYIPLARLDPKVLATRKDRVTVEKDESADYITDVRTKQATDIEVPLSDIGTDPDKVRAAVERAFGEGDAATSVFSKAKDPASYQKIIDFIGQEIVKHDDGKAPLIDQPKIILHLYVDKEMPETSDPATVVEIFARGFVAGTVKGKPNIAPYTDYDKLVYCYQKHQLERESYHDAGHKGN